MTTNQTALAGYFANQADAQRAIQDLMNTGFPESDIDFAPYHDASVGQYAGSNQYLESSDYITRSSDSYANTAGGVLVTVTGPRAAEARAILERDGADVSDRVNPGLANEGMQRIQLREERLSARKQTVQAGEVEVHKDVITETRSIDVPVSHEEVVIERRPVTGVASTDAPIGQGETIRVPLSREEVTLEKQAFVREEVEVGKRLVTETQHLTGTVRREEARVENTGDVRIEDGDHRDQMLDVDAPMQSGAPVR